MLALVLAIYLVSLIGCQSPNAVLTGDKSAVYMYDMKGTVNGTLFDGVGVIPPAQSYELIVSSLIDVDLITIASCHRDFHQEAAIKSDWLEPRRTFRYVYTPSPGLEDQGSCLLRIGAYVKQGGQAAWAVVDFRTPDATLPATNYCNGAQGKAAGVTICQSRVGLIQRLGFDVAVETALQPTDRCAMRDVKGDGKLWEFTLPSGECTIAFQEVQAPHRMHRHTTVSYTDIMIRGGQ